MISSPKKNIIWADIDGFEGYRINNMGMVTVTRKRLLKTPECRLMLTDNNKSRYSVSLKKAMGKLPPNQINIEKEMWYPFPDERIKKCYLLSNHGNIQAIRTKKISSPNGIVTLIKDKKHINHKIVTLYCRAFFLPILAKRIKMIQ